MAVFLITGCSKQTDPFGPAVTGSTPSYTYNILAYAFDSSYEGDPNTDMTSACFYSTSPYIIDYKVYASWYPNQPIGSMENVRDDSENVQSYNSYNGEFFYVIDEPHSFIPITLSGSDSYKPTASFISLGSEITRYNYKYYPVNILIVDPVISDGIAYHRFYKAAAVDIYGQTTAYQDFSIKFCNAKLMLIYQAKYYEDGETAVWDGNNDNCKTRGVGTVMAESGNTYTIEFNFSQSMLSGLQEYQGSSAWLIYGVEITDLANNSTNVVTHNPGSPAWIRVERLDSDDDGDGD